jgi:CubicO group peptidase (beta-lactamase class C family)
MSLFFCAFSYSTQGQSTLLSNTSTAKNHAYCTDTKAIPPVLLAQLNSQLDSIITIGIKKSAFPGAQILVAHNGAIVFHETYGYHTYDSIQQVQPTDLYDLASVTKIK